MKRHILGLMLILGTVAPAYSQVPLVETAPIPIGMVVAYAGDVGPPSSEIRTKLAASGWLVCDGDRVLRTKYPRLFAIIGEIHGSGDVATSFNLPDYRGRFLRGVDAGAGRDTDSGTRRPANTGGLGGDQVGSVEDDEIGSHSHTTIQMIGDNNVDGVDSTVLHSGEHHNEQRSTGFCCGKETRPKNANVIWLIYAGKPAA
jgi:microcystin-dependent protein